MTPATSRAPTSCSPRSTPSSARSPRRCGGRCGCWPARAPARPGRSPTGSPTASPPASTTRPRCWRSPSPPAPPARCAPGCAGSGAGGVQARTFHSAALRQARFFWPKVYGGELPELTESKLGLLGNAARRNRVATDQATLRDLASEIEWAKVSNVRPDDYARRRAAARGRAVTGLDAGDRRPRLRDLRGRQARPGPDGHGGRAALRRGAARRGRARRRAGPPAVQVVRRRRVPGRQPDPGRAARPVARRSRRACAWSATRRRRSTPSPAPTRPTSATSPRKHPRHHVGRAGPQLPLHAAGGGRGQPAAAGRRPAPGVQLRSQQEGGPEVRFAEHADEVAEAEQVAADVLGLRRGGHARRARSRCCSGSTRSPRRSRRRWPRAACPTSSAARPGSSTGAEVRAGGRPAARRRAQRRAATEATSSRPTRAVLAGMGWSEQAPTGRGNARDRWESLQAIVSQAADLAARPARGRPGRLRRRARPPRRRAARPGRRGRHAGDAARRQGPRVGRRLRAPACRRAPCRSSTPRAPAAVEEERRLLYVGMTRARRALTVSWSLARNPGGRATRKPSRFLDRAASRDAPPTAARAGHAAASARASRTAASAASRWPPTAERKVGRCADCPASYDEELFERLRGLARRAAPAQEKVPAYVVFTDLTLQAIAEVKPGRRAGAAADQRHRPGQAGPSTATTCSRWWPATSPAGD